MMIKKNFANLFFTIIRKTICNVFICAFILSIGLYGCAPKISEIHPIIYNYEDQNKLKVAIINNLVIGGNLAKSSQDEVDKQYYDIINLLSIAFNKEKYRIVLNPIKYVNYWTKKDYFINAGIKMNVDYIINIRFEETLFTNWPIDKAMLKIYNIHSGESFENHFTTTRLDTNTVANNLFGFFDNFISQCSAVQKQ